MKAKTTVTTTQASIFANDSFRVAGSVLRDQPLGSLAANPKYGDHITWQMVPLFAQRIVDLLSPSGLLPDMNDNVLVLALRIMHGEEANVVMLSVDKFWNEVPELIDAVVSLFTASQVPTVVADCTIALARQLLRDGAGA